MKIYEAKLHYEVVAEQEMLPMDRADLIAAYMRPIMESNAMSEGVYLLSLNHKKRLLFHTMVTLGTVTGTIYHAREVFRPAILANAAAIAVCHNHPTGDPTPSLLDIKYTASLRDASKVLDIPLVDHVIVGEVDADPRGLGFFSFKAARMI